MADEEIKAKLTEEEEELLREFEEERKKMNSVMEKEVKEEVKQRLAEEIKEVMVKEAQGGMEEEVMKELEEAMKIEAQEVTAELIDREIKGKADEMIEKQTAIPKEQPESTEEMKARIEAELREKLEKEIKEKIEAEARKKAEESRKEIEQKIRKELEDEEKRKKEEILKKLQVLKQMEEDKKAEEEKHKKEEMLKQFMELKKEDDEKRAQQESELREKMKEQLRMEIEEERKRKRQEILNKLDAVKQESETMQKSLLSLKMSNDEKTAMLTLFEECQRVFLDLFSIRGERKKAEILFLKAGNAAALKNIDVLKKVFFDKDGKQRENGSIEIPRFLSNINALTVPEEDKSRMLFKALREIFDERLIAVETATNIEIKDSVLSDLLRRLDKITARAAQSKRVKDLFMENVVPNTSLKAGE